MRIWSVHPKYLDAKGLVALWRETLLAQHVLLGKTRGYVNHPQLQRFREQRDPLAAIGAYLVAVQEEASRRGYRFDGSKIQVRRKAASITVSDGQLGYEWQHLKRKLEARDADAWAAIRTLGEPLPHPLFNVRPGPVADWEKR